jgi:hypothetical protein
MTGKERGDIFGDALDSLSLEDFGDGGKVEPPSQAEQKKTKDEAKTIGFKSREAKSSVPQRRRRTGRNAQLNIKVTPETMQAFYAIADKEGWVLGEAMEKAVKLLEKEYSGK